ncbi:hypothetical protein HYALB_00012270 [Hymenoscyphus albidus]|uniref:Uncharacterized protein n=1 Tax=Hymenoscyphus albidus TaxID=595503 RepID=A0A9N9Q809_9HELO|nr:hypothetical protein HYALB_00012270 [Hymenoscyphus albidus]
MQLLKIQTTIFLLASVLSITAAPISADGLQVRSEYANIEMRHLPEEHAEAAIEQRANSGKFKIGGTKRQVV